MNSNISVELDQVLTELELPTGLDQAETATLLHRYLTDPAPPPPPGLGQAAEEIIIAQDEVGAFKVATTDKLSNLKFKLGGLLEEALELAIDVPGAVAFPPKLVKVGLDSYRRLRKLATLTISEEQARVLLVIYQLRQDKQTPTLDLIHDQTKLEPVQVIDALDVLERLDCIVSQPDGTIELHETIIVKQAEEA